MKAEELNGVLEELSQTINSILRHDGWANDLTRLNKLWDKLNQHRLGLAAEADRSRWRQCERCAVAMVGCRENELLCPKCRLDDIEKRLEKIERQAESANKQLAEHSHGRAVYVVNV